jgi:hypothetical protein
MAKKDSSHQSSPYLSLMGIAIALITNTAITSFWRTNA